MTPLILLGPPSPLAANEAMDSWRRLPPRWIWVVSPPTAVVRYGAYHSPKLPSAIASNDATTQLQIPLVPNGGGRGLIPAAIILAVITGRYPSSTIAVFTRTVTNEKRPWSPTLYITRQSTSQKRRWGITVSSSVNGTAEQRVADATRKARGGTNGNNEHNNQPVGHATIHASERRGAVV